MARTRHGLSGFTLWLRTLGTASVCVGLASSIAPAALAQDADSADQLWSDFAHYVLIARPQLAADAATALLETEAGSILDAVEASDYRSPASLFERASGMDGVSGLADQLQAKIESARLDRSRDEQRIADNIQLLDDGARPYRNAVNRLTAAGQYAAPALLETLRNGDDTLKPFVVRAMVDIGQPLVAPLSAALPDLEVVPQGQATQVLAEIGYPYATAAIKRVLEDPATDPGVKQRAQIALEQLADNARIDTELPAATLYHAVGLGAYKQGTIGEQPVGFDAAENKGLLWKFGREIGLVPIEVPASVYADALARDAATTALSLNPELAEALTLFLASDLRAGNRIGEGETDPSRSVDLQPAEFYALLAGPQRLREVLDTAIDDGDAALALDAIAALSQTASIDALQPLTRALAYPDRRVRFEAAQALAHAMPESGFEGDARVVPVLAESIRQGGSPIALVLADDQPTRNVLADAASSLGYEPLLGASMADVGADVVQAAGIDLVLMQGSADAVGAVMEQSKRDYKLAGTPVVAAVSVADETRLSGIYEADARLTTFAGQADESTVASAIQAATEKYAGSPIGADEAEAFATESLGLLGAIAMSGSVYDAGDATPALIEALTDERESVASAAADVLAMLNDPVAQAAIAAAAIDGVGEVQLSQLGSLADSANRYGNMVSAETGDALLALVRESDGDLAIAAAKAHGALSLPTQQSVTLILEAQ
ncbi:MAG: HEAT repeat domain-containing protein [Planctomycetota bacterium]